VIRAITIASALACATPAAAIECHSSSAGMKTWREIDGRRCWYVGPRRIAKPQLHWIASTVPRKEGDANGGQGRSEPKPGTQTVRTQSNAGRTARSRHPGVVPIDDPNVWPARDEKWSHRE